MGANAIGDISPPVVHRQSLSPVEPVGLREDGVADQARTSTVEIGGTKDDFASDFR